MTSIEEEAKQLLDSISREELIELLNESGVLVQEGTGKIIYKKSEE